MKLHHIALKVKDLSLCEKFYRDVLKLPLAKQEKSNAGRSVWFQLSETILMIEREETTKSNDSLVALEISADERESRKKRLQTHGVVIEKETPYSLYFSDPEGNKLALSHHPQKAGGV